MGLILKACYSLLKKIFFLGAGYGGLLGLLPTCGWAVTQHYRLILTETPTTSVRIGWELIGGCPDTQRVYYDTIDHGQDTSAYAFQARITASFFHRGMENYFARLEALQPDTRYYFVIAEDQGISPRLWFNTFPETTRPWRAYWVSPEVSKAPRAWKHFCGQTAQHPVDFVLIDGLSHLHTDEGWGQWLQDWQSSITENGRIVPLVVGGELTADVQYLFNLTSKPSHTYLLSPQSTLVAAAQRKLPGKRFWKHLPPTAFVLLHTPFPFDDAPAQVDLVLTAPLSEATLAPNTFAFPPAFPFVEMGWQEGRLGIRSPERKKLLDVYANY